MQALDSFLVIPMSDVEFKKYSKFSYDNHIKELMLREKLNLESAILKAGHDVPKRMTQDLCYTLKLNNKEIGYIWFRVKEKSAFGFDFWISEEYRGQGWGRKTLVLVSKELKKFGIKSLSFLFFKDNTASKKLYSSMGITFESKPDNPSMLIARCDL